MSHAEPIAAALVTELQRAVRREVTVDDLLRLAAERVRALRPAWGQVAVVLVRDLPDDGATAGDAGSVALTVENAAEADDGERAVMVDAVADAVAVLARLHESTRVVADLHAAMEARALIDQALGILMAHHRCAAPQALDLLRRVSQRDGRKIRELAAALIEDVSGHPATTGAAFREAGPRAG